LSVNRLKSIKLDQVKRNFEEKIRAAETDGDQEEIKKLIKDFQKKIIDQGRQSAET
jgi:hypothetical protein